MSRLEDTDAECIATDTLLLGDLVSDISKASRDPNLITLLYNKFDSRLSAYRIAIALARSRESAARSDAKEATTSAESYQAQLADASDLADDQIKRCADLEQKLRTETEKHNAAYARDLVVIRALQERLRVAGLDASLPAAGAVGTGNSDHSKHLAPAQARS